MCVKHPLNIAIAIALATVATDIHAQTLQTQQRQTPGDTTTSEPVALDRVIVMSQYESQVRAIDIKRQSDAISDTVSSDSMGQYPDKNVGESLSRLPGVSVTRDQGEGRYVVVRGLDAALNSVTVDGVSIGTPEDSSRASPLDMIPSDSTERLTVIKSPTPDLPGDSIGGTVLVESASGFDRKGQSIRGKVELSKQSLSGKTSPKASFNYSNVFDGNFAVALGVSVQDRDYESDNIEGEYDYHDSFKKVLGMEDTLVMAKVSQRKYYINRKRTGLNLNLDWRPNASSSYFLRTLYTDFTDAETRQNSIIPTGDGDIVAHLGKIYDIEGIDPGDFSRRIRFRTKKENTFTVSTGGENRFGHSAVDYRLAFTRTREDVSDEVEARFEYDGDDDVSLVLDQTGSIPRYTITDSPLGGWLDNDNYAFNRFVVGPKWVDDRETSAAVNFRFDGEVVTWKAGLLGRWRDRDLDADEHELRVGPDINLGNWTSGSPDYAHGDMGNGISSDAFRKYLTAHLADYSARKNDIAANIEASLVEDYVASEDILAGYLMATANFGDLRVVAGLRVERTTFAATGNVVELKDAKTIKSISTRDVSSSYTSVLPGLHLRYDMDDWVLRGAFTKSIARPAFGDISPRIRINRDEDEVELGNPMLDPYQSSNFDVSIERYIGKSGIFSLGLFRKDIKGYIAETVTANNPDYPGFDVSTPINGDDARVNGVETNWQQHFDNGLLLGFSATWLDTKFMLPADAALADRVGETFQLPRASKQLYSAHIGYEKGGLSTRVAAVRRSAYLEEIGDDPNFDIWVAANTQLDFTLDYKVNGMWGFYFEAANLLDNPLELYQGSTANTLQYEQYGRTYTAGIKLRF